MSRYRNPTSIDTLILHCAATPNGQWFTAEDIDRWHAERGFHRDPGLVGAASPHLTAIGYHFVIYTTGAVTCGRALRETGAHAAGHNITSIGTCLIGTDRFTPAQWEVLRLHVRSLQRDYPGLRVIGHREVNAHKTCPGFDVQAWLDADMAPADGHVLEDDHA